MMTTDDRSIHPPPPPLLLLCFRFLFLEQLETGEGEEAGMEGEGCYQREPEPVHRRSPEPCSPHHYQMQCHAIFALHSHHYSYSVVFFLFLTMF